MATELQNLINNDDEPSWVIVLENELTEKQGALLAQLIHEIKTTTSYGVVKVVVCDKRVQTIKIEKSFDAR